MADENDDKTTQQNDTTQGNDTTQQQDTTQQSGDTTTMQPAARGTTDIDKKLDAFMESTDAPRKAAADTKDTKAAAGDTKAGTKAAGGANADATSTTQGGTAQQIPAAARQFGAIFRSDAQGNIYTDKGELIAKAGHGHAIFRKIFPYVQAYEKELGDIRTRMQTFENANQVAKSAGLTLDEQGAGLQLMVQWKKAPVQTIKTLLNFARENGIDVSELQQGGAAFDPAAIRGMMQEVVAAQLKPLMPLAQQLELNAADAEANEAVVHDYNTFMGEFPDAKMHEGALARVMNDRPGMSVREAYYALRALAATHGLDWTKDLAEQYTARDAANGRQTNGGGDNRQLPNMGGRGSDGSTIAAGANDLARPDESWDAIARRTMAKHGINVE